MAFSVGNLAAGGGGGAQVSQGPELELIQTEGFGFLNLAGETKLQFVSKWADPPLPTASLISIASRKGLVAAAGPDAVHIATTDAVRKAITSEDASNDDDSNVRPFAPQITIPMTMRVSQLAFTADENYLVLSAETGGGLAVYEVQTLLNNSSSGSAPTSAFELSTNGETVRALVVNPMADKAELCALVTANGNLLMADLQQRALRNGPSGQPVLRSQVSSAAWSSRGKQLVAGCADGSVYQMTPDGQEKAHIPKPPSVVGDCYVASLAWLENDVFLVVHNPNNTSGGDPSTYHIVTRNAKASPPELVYQKLNDPVEPFGDKTPHHTILRLRDFPPNLQDALLVASTAVENIGLLTRSKSPLASNVPADKITNVFTTTELADDSRRAQLPMSADYSETFPVGAALDLSSTEKVPKPIPTDEMDESPGPLPGLWVLNNEGVLLAWWVVYNESIREGTTYPGLVAAGGGAPSAAASTPAAPAPALSGGPFSSPAPAPALSGGPFSSPKPSAPAFGTSATPATPAPAFGASPWGQPAAATASPSRAPAFGAPSVLGGAAFGAPSGLAGAKPSVWGSGAKTTSGPAFGQTSFGAPAAGGSPAAPATNAFSAFAKSTSPFGSAAAASSSDKPAGTTASPFGAFNNTGQSGFAALSTAKTNGSIFGSGSASNKPFGSTSNGSAFGAPSTGSSAFGAPSTGSSFGAPAFGAPQQDSGSIFGKPAGTSTTSGASPFGSTPFVLGTTFKPDPKTANENEDSKEAGSSGGSLFGSGFGLALADAAKKEPASAPEKDEDMDVAAEPAKTEASPAASTPAATPTTTTTTTATTAPSASIESTTPTTTPAPAGSRFFSPLASSDKEAPATSLFGASKTAATTGSSSLFGSSSTPSGTTSSTANPFSGFTKPGGDAASATAAPSLFGSKTPGSAAPSLFGKPSGQAAAAPSLFGKPSGLSAAPSLFSQSSGTGAAGAGTGKGLFGQASAGSGMFSGFAKPADTAAKKDDDKKEANDTPLPPDTTKPANPFSSSQKAKTTTTPAAASEPPLPPNPFAQPKKEAAAVSDIPLPPDPFTKPKNKSETPAADAKVKTEPKPAAPTSLFASLGTSSKPFSVFSSGALPSNDSGMKTLFADLPKESPSPTTDGSEEEDYTDNDDDDDEEEEEEQAGRKTNGRAKEDEEDGEVSEEEDDDEGSGTDIGKDVTESPSDLVKTPSYATHGSFSTVGAMDASVTSGFSHIEPSRSQIFGGPPDLRPPRQQDTSPRSPSPQRPPAKGHAGISAGRLFREESQRSFSAPGMASQILRDSRQGRLPGGNGPAFAAQGSVHGGGGGGGLFAAGRRTVRDANLEEQRKADEARINSDRASALRTLCPKSCTMSKTPWEGSAPQDQLFVLVTGANSGIGLGIGQRLIDEFAALFPSPTTHLTLIITTRSPAKSRATTDTLRRYLDQQEHGARVTSGQKSIFPNRVHLASIELDFCNLPSVYAAAERLRREPIAIVTGLSPAVAPTNNPSPPHPVSAVIPRLDSVIFNAGIGGWTGLNWTNLFTSFVKSGFVHATTFPTCKDASGGLLVDPLTGKAVAAAEIASAANGNDAVKAVNEPGSAVLGQVFCANVFGHYVFAHELLPLLSTGSASAVSGPTTSSSAAAAPARIIWESSVESVCWHYLSPDDLQGVGTTSAYESSKRLTDVLAITADLDGVKACSAPYFGQGGSKEKKEDATVAVPPATYVTHPGIVCSSLFPLHWVIFYFYQLGMYLSRLFGSPWHAVTAYKGAAAPVWVALQEQPALDVLDARHVKWGTGTTRMGTPIVKRTEVEGWGWRGRLHEEQYCGDPRSDPLVNTFGGSSASYLRNSLGRREDAVPLTAERRQEFEALGRDCWREMERLRLEWDAKVRAFRGR